MAKLYVSSLAAILCFALISGCLGKTCQIDIGDPCINPAVPTTCNETCIPYIGNVFEYSQCIKDPNHEDYYHCRCFYKCRGNHQS
ncbi:hypothetical protein BUALT_Bualt15G0088500 [Buddleja alternifolia]|uniref:Uncharacterized protein n=1 Tax=Buddleja alternifolia TaxID=168488 RepID=A0AAV6WM00_9LAMI|nr:hypothetical protein BUALT_Bualt15G0088500 [Buddleja alternifolia]